MADELADLADVWHRAINQLDDPSVRPHQRAWLSLTRPIGLLLAGVLLQRLGGVTTVLIAAGWLAALLALIGLSPALRDTPQFCAGG